MRGALVLALILAAPPVLAQSWDEVAGGPGRTGAAFLPSATLDVLESRVMFPDDMRLEIDRAKGLVVTPHGMIALAQRDDGACMWMIVDADRDESRVLDGCRWGTLTAYDRGNDRIIVCSVGTPTDFVLQARDAATGELVWGIRPGDLGLAASGPTDWDCKGTTISPENDALYVAFVTTEAYAGAYVARAQTSTGEVVWDRSISAGDLAIPPANDVTSTTGGFTAHGISLTDSGLIVAGRTYCVCDKGDPGTGAIAQGSMLWMDAADGDIIGTAQAQDDSRALGGGGVPSRHYGQWWATTQGPLGAFALGGRMLVVNPTEPEPVREASFRPIETGRGFVGIVPSAWWSSFIVVPVAESVTAVDAMSLEPAWSWTGGDGWIVSALMVVPPSDVLVVVASDRNGNNDADAPASLHRLDLKTGSPLQRIDLPETIRMSGGTGRVRAQPLDDGRLLLYSEDGRLFTMGEADVTLVPRFDVSNLYPAPSENVQVNVVGADDSINYTISWGDGTIEADGTSWTHRYGDEGTHIMRVTAAFPDGRTATAERTIRVGATPPPQLSAIQKAFAPERQDLTFGLLGLAVTFIGALIALAARRRRHSKLRTELETLTRIETAARVEAEPAVRELGQYRAHLFDELSRRRLDDTQFNTLSARADLVAAAIRMRLLGPVAGRLTDDFRQLVDVALHDGRVEPDELEGIQSTLSAERGLTSDEKDRLLSLFSRLAQR